MIQIFNIPQYTVDTSQLGHLLHGKIVREFEEQFASYVGAKYSCSLSSATAAIFLTFQGSWASETNIVKIPSIIPYVVPNVLTQCGNVTIDFYDDVNWVGGAYTLHEFMTEGSAKYIENYFKVIDSAQEVIRNQFSLQANDEDLMIFSFYPTKPVGSCDGGMIVSNDKEKIDWFRKASMYGASPNNESWGRQIEFPGYKMYMSSIQAYIALQNLNKLDKKKKILGDIREYYNSELGYNNTSHHLYRIRTYDNQAFIKKMKSVGIQCGVHYHPCHRMDACQNCTDIHISKCLPRFLPLPKSVNEGVTTVSIPFHEALTNEELHYIVKKIKETI